MLSDCGNQFIIDPSESLNMGTFQGLTNQAFQPSRDLVKVIRVLLSLFDFSGSRPFQRRIELLQTIKDLRNNNIELKNRITELKNEIFYSKQNYEQKFRQMEQEMETLKKAKKHRMEDNNEW